MAGTAAGEKQPQGAEEKCPVPAVVNLRQDHRAAEGEAAFVLQALRLLHLEERPCVQGRVLQVIVYGAMQRIRSGLDHRVREPASEAAVFGVERIAHHAKLLDHLHGRSDFFDCAPLNPKLGHRSAIGLQGC